MTPKFKVGEKAILRSIRYPGAITVEILGIRYSSIWCNPETGIIGSGFTYFVSPDPGDPSRPYAECALHKIPPLADQSFSDLMTELKQPAPEAVTVAK